MGRIDYFVALLWILHLWATALSISKPITTSPSLLNDAHVIWSDQISAHRDIDCFHVNILWSFLIMHSCYPSWWHTPV